VCGQESLRREKSLCGEEEPVRSQESLCRQEKPLRRKVINAAP
jgi:hypothetical protein